MVASLFGLNGISIPGFIINLGASPYNADPNGMIDATQAINSGIAYLNSIGGGVAMLPPGTYKVNGPGSDKAILMQSNVMLCGVGRNVTNIRLDNSANDNVIAWVNPVSNIAICDLSIDGNYLNQSPGYHGIRSSGVTDCLIENVTVHDCSSYGISFGVGTTTRLRIQNVNIYNTLDDGIDLKNPNSNNSEIYLDSITIRTPGLSTIDPGQTGIDIRGPVQASNIVVYNVRAGNVGIRFRNTGTAGAGAGGNYSSLTNFRVYCDSNSTSLGVSVPAYGCQVSNGYIYGAYRAVESLNENNKFINIVCEECTEGYVSDSAVDDFAVVIRGNLNDYVNCHYKRASADVGTRAFRVTAFNAGANVGVSYIGCTVQNASEGCNFAAAVQANVINCDLTATTAPTNDSSSLTVYRNNRGLVNESNVVTAGLAIDSIGRKTFSIAHGLGFTPALKDVALTVLANTVVTDMRLGACVVESVSSTVVNGALYVITASATGGATAFVGIKTSTKSYN